MGTHIIQTSNSRVNQRTRPKHRDYGGVLRLTRGSQKLATLLLLSLILLTTCQPLPNPRREVTLVADGQLQTIETELTSVRALLEQENIYLDNMDRVTPPETAKLTSGMIITVTRVVEQRETFTQTVPFERRVVRDSNVPEGESRLLQSGEPGILQRMYRITLEDDLEVERTLVQETLIQEPRDEVQLIGVRPQVQTVPITGTLVYLNNQDAWHMRDTNRVRHRLTTLGDLDGRVFELAPDGSQLLFTRAVTTPEHINELWAVRTAEADPNPVPLNLQDLIWAAWSPDGERIAWTTAEPTERAPGWRGKNDLWIATLTARNILVSKRKVLDEEAGGGYGWWGTRYAWAPDSDKLAYSRPESVGVVALNQAKRISLLSFPAYRTYSSWAWSPIVTWSNNGKFLATVVHGPAPDNSDPEESPVFDLWILEATGAYSAEIASEVGMWATPHFSLDDDTLLFGRAIIPYQSDISTYNICVIDRDGSNPQCLYPSGEEPGSEATSWQWSPDGQYIAFIRQGDIYLLERSDQTSYPITDEDNVSILAWQ